VKRTTSQTISLTRGQKLRISLDGFDVERLIRFALEDQEKLYEQDNEDYHIELFEDSVRDDQNQKISNQVPTSSIWTSGPSVVKGSHILLAGPKKQKYQKKKEKKKQRLDQEKKRANLILKPYIVRPLIKNTYSIKLETALSELT
jgi:hypothetical protein